MSGALWVGEHVIAELNDLLWTAARWVVTEAQTDIRMKAFDGEGVSTVAGHGDAEGIERVEQGEEEDEYVGIEEEKATLVA